MSKHRKSIGVLGLLVGLSTAATGSPLTQALQNRDGSQLRREARKQGVTGLLRDLESNQRLPMIAALEGARYLSHPAPLLPRIRELAGHPDRTIAAAAVNAAADVVSNLDPMELELLELHSAWLRREMDGWLALAIEERFPDIRIYSLEVAVGLFRLIDDPSFQKIPYEGLLADSDPEVVAGSLSLLPVAGAPGLFARKLEEAPLELALIAGQSLCTHAPLPQLSIAAKQRLITLAEAQELSIEVRADLWGCLAEDPSPSAKAALEGLVRQSPPGMKRTLMQKLKTR